jgi:predicted acetyltransferase
MEDLILVRPSEEFTDDIRAFRQECIDAGSILNGTGILGEFDDPIGWIDHCRSLERADTLPDVDWVTADQYMLVRRDSGRILGMINIRHHLNEHLSKFGGHIGYTVRPSERRKGYAKMMITLCIDRCLGLGLEKVLITCRSDNEASRRTILSAGGVYESTVYYEVKDVNIERYWVTFTSRPLL